MGTRADTKLGRLAAVYDQLRAGEPLSVSELAERTRLSRPTVTGLLAQLEQDGLATASAPEVSGTGRPAVSWRLSPLAGFVVGVDLLEDAAVVSVARLSGEVTTATLEPVSSLHRSARLARIVELIERCVADHRDTLGPVRAVTVSTTGTVGSDGRILRSTNVPEWDDFPLGEELTRRLGLEVRVENDVNCSAFGEFIARRDDTEPAPGDSLLYVHVATGIVTGMVLDGRLHRGTSHNAGEFGLRLEEVTAENDSSLRKVATTIGAVAAAIDPAVIVVSGRIPSGDFAATLQVLWTQALVDSAPRHRFEPERLGAGAAVVGALALALADAQTRFIGLEPAEHHPLEGLETLRAALPSSRPSAAGATSAIHVGEGPLRVGVVGVGARSTIARHVGRPGNHATVVAACDPLPTARERLRDWTQLDPLQVAVTHTLDDFIALGLDAAVVTSPDDTHAEIACRLLEAGIAVYLEKPLAIDLDGATRILTTAETTGTKLYVGHNMRHMGVVRTLRDLIAQGRIGQVKAIWCRHFVGHGGDFYFKDWHADRRRSHGLLLQKAAHDLDVMNWLANSHPKRVVGMGGLTVYGDVTDRRDHAGELMHTWLGKDWPPLAATGLNPVVDVEDISMLSAELDSGVFVSYQQCHYTPDYWRNYTVIGTEGRLENFGDGEGGHVVLYNRRTNYNPDGDARFPIHGDREGHDDADIATMAEFLSFVRTGQPTDTSPVGAWYAAATAIQATNSIRSGSVPMEVPELPAELLSYFANHQRR